MADPTIVLASLSDDKLKESINSLVKHVNDKMEEMVESTNSAVKRMEDKLKSLGSLKIDTGGTNDGGTGRRTQQHEKLTKAVNDASEAVSKETQKLQDLQQSLSGASDREQNFISQKERAANTIAQENELLQRQEQELANLKNQQSSFSGANQQTTASIDKQRESVANLKNEVKYWQSIVSQIQSGDKKTRFNSLWIGDTTSKQGHDILDVANKLYSIMQKLGMETEKGSASTGQAVKVVEQLAKYYKISREEAEKLVMSVQESPLARGKFTTHYDTRFGLDNLTMQKKDAEDSSLRLMIVQSKLERQTDDLALANKRLADSENSSTQASQQKAQIDSQIAAKEKEIADTKVRIATAIDEQTKADKNASQAAREKANIQSQVANQEKQVAEAKRQLTTATHQQAEVEKQSVQNVAQQTAARDKQIKKNQETAMSFDNIASATTKAARSASTFIQSERESLRMRQNEIQAKIDSLRKQFGNVEIKTIVRDDGTFSRAVDKAKQKIEEIRRQLQNVPPTSALGKQFSQELQAARNEYNELIRSRKAFEAKSQIASLVSEYEQNNKKLRELATAYRQLYTDEKQAENAMNNGAAAIARYGDSAEKAQQKLLKASFNRAINILPQGDDLAYAKLERLRAILADHRFLGALSPSEIKRARAEVQKLESQLVDYINKMNSSTQAQQQATNANSQQSRSIDEMNAYIAQNIRREQERRDAIRQTGFAARETADQLIRSAHEQASAHGNSPITGIKELTVAVEQMRRAYFDMSASERMSPVGTALEADIKRANEAITVIRKYNQSLFGVEQNDSHRITNASTLESLRASLKVLTDQYNKLTVAELNAGKGDALIQHFQDTTRAAQILQRTLNRPVSLKAALAGDERTLDDIAYKMQRLRAYKQGIDLTKQNAANEIKQVDEALAKLQKDADKWMSKSQQMIKNNTALGRSWNYMKNRLAFYFTVGAGTQFIKNLIEVRSQYEMNERALGILIDSAERGTQIFNDLSQMALVSPYTLIELSAAAKQLTAYDVAAKDVVDTTRRLADMAAAVGIPIERLTYALGQIKAYGYLNSRDARMFANAGIPLVKQLADRYSELEGKMVSTADVYDRMKKKAIDYNDVMAVINKMTDEGGKFFDFQAKMAETLKVRLANLTLAWNNMLNDMGKDNQGVMTTGLKGLTVMFKHWMELYRIISTVIVAIGAYKAASMLVGIATSRAVSSTIPAWFRLANIVRTTQGNMALLGLTMRSIPFTAWVTAIATLASYFILFNNSSDDVKQKLEGIKSAFDGVRKEVETMFADAIKTDNIGTQLTKLRDMLELAETELGVTIPIKLEDVNESNVRQKLKEAKQFIDEYVNFSQTFSEAAAGTKFNELMNDFGSKARSTYTNVTESINSVIVALQELSDKGQASKRDIEILNELTSGQKDDESRIEYLQRLVSLYEELGLIGQKKVTPKISFFGSSEDNIEELEQQQENALNRLSIKNKSVFENMLKDVQGYYSSSSIAAYQFEQQVMRVAEKIDINNIPVEQRTMKLTAAINEEASQNNWNQFEKEFARQIANERFGTTIEISDESKKAAEEDLQAWQRNIKEWAKNNGITFDVSFQTNDTEASYAKRMLQEAKDAKEIWETLGRKEKQGTGSKDATTKAYNEYLDKRKLAAAAGADLSSLDAKSRKAASKAESELTKALKDELSTIEKVRSIYKDLVKDGASHANAVARATSGWDETVNAINKVLQKNGLKKLNLADFVGIDNPRDILKTLQAQLDALVKRGASSSEIKVLQEKIQTVSVDADKYDLTKITKGLNSELDRLKDEYELAIALDADPELGSIFADWMGFDMDNLPRTAQEYAKRYTDILNKKMKERKADIELPNLLNITDDDLRELQNRVGTGGITQTYVDEITKGVKAVRDVFSKELTSAISNYGKLLDKYGDYVVKVKRIEEEAATERKDLVLRFGNEQQKSKGLQLHTEILEEEDPVARQKLVDDLENLTNEVSKANPVALKINAAIGNSKNEKLAQAGFEEFQKSREWVIATGDLATLSRGALGMLIEEIEKYKKTAKNLTPKQIKAINNTLKQLKREVRKNNPFAIIRDTIEDSRERMADYKSDMKTVMDKIIEYEKKIGDRDATEDEKKDLNALKQEWQDLYDKMKKIGEGSTDAIVEGLNAAIQMTKQASSMFTDMFEAFGNDKVVRDVNRVFAVVDKVGQGAAMGASVGGGWGAIIGGATGLISGLVTTFADQWSGNKAITERVQEAERAVKRLENAYRELEFAAENAFGTAVAGANQAIKTNKELQLVELKRQLALEQSRSSKNKDEDKIIDLTGQIIDLENEISKATSDTLNNLLGISSHGDFFEDMISEMISAFKNGEDAMKVFEEKWADMIDNMITKTIVSQVLQNWVDSLEDGAQKILDKFTAEPSKAVADLTKQMTDIYSQDAGDISEWIYDNDRAAFNKILNSLGVASPNFMRQDRDDWFDDAWNSGLAQKIADAYKNTLGGRMDTLNKNLDKASLDATGDLIDYYSMAGEEFKANYLDVILDKIKENWTFGQDSQKDLSQLQQGISQISEQTANSIEAYLNGVSQQVYYHSTLLEQIRDAIMGTNSDIQLGVQGQMLLQLQNNYIIMQSIQSMMENWTVPSGSGIRVELMS